METSVLYLTGPGDTQPPLLVFMSVGDPYCIPSIDVSTCYDCTMVLPSCMLGLTDKLILLSLYVSTCLLLHHGRAPVVLNASVTTDCFGVTQISTHQLIRLFLFHNQTDLTDLQNASCDKRRRIGVRQKGKKWRW